MSFLDSFKRIFDNPNVQKWEDRVFGPKPEPLPKTKDDWRIGGFRMTDQLSPETQNANQLFLGMYGKPLMMASPQERDQFLKQRTESQQSRQKSKYEPSYPSVQETRKEQRQPFQAFSGKFTQNTPDQYKPMIAEAAEKYGIPSPIFSALLRKESMNFNPDVISGKIKSPAGAIGIAQFMPETAKSLGVDPLNVEEAIDGAARYLAQFYYSFGEDWPTALSSYNAGPTITRQYGGPVPYPETQQYIEDVLNYSKEIAP